jgi:hypothetical protein
MKEEELKQEEWSEVEELRQEATEKDEAVEAIKKFTEEDDNDMGEISLKSILGGDVLGSKFFLKQVIFVIFCVILMLLYTGNRYASQQDAILIDSLRQNLQNVKYNVMTQSSELMNMTRQSNVERMLKTTKDSVLQNPVTPPFLIRMDGTVEPMIKEEVNDPNLPTGDEV